MARVPRKPWSGIRGFTPAERGIGGFTPAERGIRPIRRKLGLFGGTKPDDTPAPRRHDIEDLLCRAIRERMIVSLYYEDDAMQRSFEPTAVYHSTKDKVCVSGVERGADRPKNLEVGKIRNAVVTEAAFVPDSRFDRHDKKYANGIICSV